MMQFGALALLQPSNVDFKPNEMLRLGAVQLLLCTNDKNNV
jgi:hypothetical protein